MIFYLEWKKIKRTGLIPACLLGSILAAAIPMIQMLARSEIFITQNKPPVEILLNANWQMMAMLNILLAAISTCLMYHTEYADNAIQTMRMLPIKEHSLFFGKFALMAFIFIIILTIEAAAIGFCTIHWFEPFTQTAIVLLKNFSYAFLLMLPIILLSLLIASACQNMWISLGIDVICVFTATMLPSDNSLLALFPFALPFQTAAGTTLDSIRCFIISAVLEIIGITAAEIFYLKLRRFFA